MTEHKQNTDTNNTETNSTNESSTHNHLSGFAAEAKGKTGIKRIVNAAGFSMDGFKAAFANEAAFRQLSFLNSFLLIALIFCPFALVIKMVLVFASVFSMVVELFNTAIEAAIDHTSTERHPLAKIGKDAGSAAQFLALGLIFILWSMAIFSILSG
ncbi:MAG: diacylglycerol kinase [Pseudomonadales bacterium]|nr:MAG: diacylglycerol kinase [Pseudomonadales bacterium]